MIITAALRINDQFFRVTADGQEYYVPNVPDNRHFIELQKWIATGGVVQDYVAPEPNWSQVDQAELNAMMAAKGSVVRALAIVMLKEINKLRVKNGDAAYTTAQFTAALAAEQART